ncbi:hypothetical protein BJX63DRAFT_443406 [Aspergillus granulosus]|uniref:Zn(2)-C6 fungal-type domain-containing protein n=1 Tax=Aspergillus granulosus TaxID=176169 RepID=A0ABR4HAY7_9EURO
MASVCNHCRLRRRRCDRLRPQCSFCASQGVECVYGQASDFNPSPLVQELMSIRERLEFITPRLEARLQPSTRHDDAPTAAAPTRNFPPLSIRSPHLMQILGLPSNLASVLYRSEASVPPMTESSGEPTGIESTDLILHRFREQVHRWYPVLHPDFTIQFFGSNTTGFPYSTQSCLSLLVSSLAGLGHDQLYCSHFKAALSMIPIVFQECSVASVQCLVLFSICFACRLQPRQAYTYIQAACLKIQPLIKSPYLSQESSEYSLVTRLYWTIYLIESEIAMHLSLSSCGKTCRRQLATIPLPTSTYMWDYIADSNSPWISSLSNTPPTGRPIEPLQSHFYFVTEVHLQLVLNNHVSLENDMPGPFRVNSLHTDGSLGPISPPVPLPDMPPSPNSPDAQPYHAQNLNGAVCLAKYHMYEVSAYWPAIYRIMLDGLVDSELLPYVPLFFESVTSFLCAAQITIGVCPAKTWFFSASIYTISISAVRALEVPSLRCLAQPRLWECLQASVGALRGPSEICPSVSYMLESLRDRLERVRG